jgi:hypothetical protein
VSIDWSDKKEVLKAVSENGVELDYASDDLKGDKEIVLAAVKEFQQHFLILV